MDLFLTILNHGGAIVLLIAIFGVEVASFVLHNESRYRSKLPSRGEVWVWWQDLQELGFEIHLQNGETWRSYGRLEPLSWRRMRENIVQAVADDKLARYLSECLQSIKDSEAEGKHAHCLVDWSALDRAYRLKLLNGTVWQFNTKSEGITESNSLAWHLLTVPDGIVHESINRISAALNLHLQAIRNEEHAQRETVTERSKQALVMANAARNAAYASASHLCGGCGFVEVGIPGGICLNCREAQGHGV